MSELGPLALESPNEQVFLGREWTSRSEYSEEIAAAIDAQVQSIIVHCYQEALRIIQENRQVIDRLVDILIDQETIEGDQFRQILAEHAQLQDEKLVVSG